MLNKTLRTGALAIAVLLPGAAAAVGWSPAPALAADDDSSRVWVEGHHETREFREVIPEESRREWVPARYEIVAIPAVTERQWIPPVTERVKLPDVTERVWVPASLNPVTRVARAGYWENRVIASGGFEDRVVQDGRFIDKIVTPATTESRLVEEGYFRDVVVKPERTLVTRKRVWVPGHFLTAQAR